MSRILMGRSGILLWPLGVIFAISGAGSLVVETIWMRWMHDWMGATAPASAATVTAYFAGSAVGAWLGGRRAARVGSAQEALRLYAGVEVCTSAGILAMPLLLAGAGALLAPVYGELAHHRLGLATLRFATALVVTLPASVAYGATFPLIGAAGLASPRAMGRRATALYATNVAGGVGGVALAAWWATPRIGVNATYGLGGGLALVSAGFLVLSASCGLGALSLAPGSARPWARPLALAVAGGLALVFARPLAVPWTRPIPGARVLFEKTGPAGVVSVHERGGERLLRLDNHYGLGGTSERLHEERQGHLPLLLHGRPKQVAFVGTATGISAGAALTHDVDTVTLVEIVPEVAEAGARYFRGANRGVYEDPRSRVVVDDARNYFRHTDDRFDVIVADLFVPWRSGIGALYSREHFMAMRDRLRPGGLVAQWLPLYQLSGEEISILLATFLDVFPTAALFRGDFYGVYPIAAAIGWRDAPATSATVEAAARRLLDAGIEDRWVTRPDALWSLYVAPLGTSDRAVVPRNTLAWPRLEFMAAAGHAGGDARKARPTGRPRVDRSREGATGFGPRARRRLPRSVATSRPRAPRRRGASARGRPACGRPGRRGGTGVGSGGGTPSKERLGGGSGRSECRRRLVRMNSRCEVPLLRNPSPSPPAGRTSSRATNRSPPRPPP